MRYPKRKREQVKYYDSDDEGEQFASDDEEEVPKTKVSTDRTRTNVEGTTKGRRCLWSKRC